MVVFYVESGWSTCVKKQSTVRAPSLHTSQPAENASLLTSPNNPTLRPFLFVPRRCPSFSLFGGGGGQAGSGAAEVKSAVENVAGAATEVKEEIVEVVEEKPKKKGWRKYILFGPRREG